MLVCAVVVCALLGVLLVWAVAVWLPVAGTSIYSSLNCGINFAAHQSSSPSGLYANRSTPETPVAGIWFIPFQPKTSKLSSSLRVLLLNTRLSPALFRLRSQTGFRTSPSALSSNRTKRPARLSQPLPCTSAPTSIGSNSLILSSFLSSAAVSKTSSAKAILKRIRILPFILQSKLQCKLVNNTHFSQKKGPRVGDNSTTIVKFAAI